jgi:Flp pilus assembly protein TadD
VQHIPSGAAIAALFRNVSMPGGTVPILRPPSEARPALTSLISAAPRDVMLYRLRAQEAEVALDFAAAEADWKTYAGRAADRYGARIELADYYHRRNEPRNEISALRAAAAAQDDPLQPATQQRGWHAFERMASIIDDEGLPQFVAEPVLRAWVARYPKQPAAWKRLIESLTAHGRFAAAESEIAAYGSAFHDSLAPVRMRASLELRRGSPDAAVAIYDRAFEPLWPDEMASGYFKLLEQEGQLRDFTGRARTALASNPANLDATARLFHYFRSQNNIPAARRALLEYRLAKESSNRPWAVDELETLAQLFERLPDINEAARLYYALYSAPPAGGPQTERALYGLANLLLSAPEQPIQFGSGDLSFYQDVATVDPSPGFLNGILSLVLNKTGPRFEYEQENQKSAAYFHRAAAARVVGLLEQKFPRSQYRAPLRAALVSADALYGDDASVIRLGREYLAAFPAGTARVSTAMQVSDALARQHRTQEEFALYDQLLRELAAKASRVPIGRNPPASSQPAAFAAPLNLQMNRPPESATPSGFRSSGYVLVLDKYLARLAALKRPLDALRVYRMEIDRNPNDPGLYERFAAFLEQNGMSSQVEDIYTRAIAKFADRSWYDKLARWYLRRRQSAALETISRHAIAVFSGTDLEAYFNEIVSQTHPDAALYRQLNLYAHERFPEDLVFVHNLIEADSRRETYDSVAAEHLLRQYWFYDPQLRSMLFERLSQQGRLYPELAQIRAANPGIANGQIDQAMASNPAAVQFAMEAEAWLSHFEAAAPAARALATAYPGSHQFTEKASSLYRSLAAYYQRDTDVAGTMAGYEQRANPRDPNILAKMGDILADREMFERARTFWDRMPATQPGQPEAYLDTATIYWDYYRYDDALRWIAAARRKFDDPAMFAYQAGAIYENKRDYAHAVREYLGGALHAGAAADRRLLRLANRPRTRDLVDRDTAAALVSDPSPEALSLRISVLEEERRRDDLQALLQTRVGVERSASELTALQETARRLGFYAIEERASARLIEITNDPVDKMRLTLAYARLLESKKDLGGGARAVDALYHDHPLILGVVRGAVDYHVRNRQFDRAVEILLDASKHARTDLAAQFTLESARITTNAGEFEQARRLLNGLLSADPLRAEYLAAMADTYLQAKDDRGFRDYQLATIQRLRQSQLTAAERIERIATIRRSLIPVLERSNDSAGAVDQYIEVIDSYPEDESLTKEAASYAVAHGQAPRMIAFYRKAAADAPRDYRWPLVLARIETAAEDYPSAIADYEHAGKARPDRADVVQAKAGLEERLMRFDDASGSYRRLYELSYRDPQWMIKVAELQARLGRSADAVTALKTAITGARSETADADFAIAERLESWHILGDAVTFADRGAKLLGADLFQPAENVAIYARIMARARRVDAVLAVLGADPGTNQQVSRAVGSVIAETYTPEEKAQLAQALIARAASLGATARNTSLLPLVQSAALVDLESRWRFESMSAQDQRIDERLITVQSQRAEYEELGRQLEEYAAANPGSLAEPGALIQAAQAFLAEGDVDGQVRVMRKALARNALSGMLLDRYLQLMASNQPQELLSIIRSNGSDDIRNRAVQLAIAGDHRDLAYQAVRARGGVLPPVWTKAYGALTGEYFNDHSSAIEAAFQSALDTRAIGERLKNPLKPDSVIVGSVWFYFGARYGDYLALSDSANAEGWLPASLEAAPQDADAYVALGDSYAARGQGTTAISQFEHALELDPDRGDAQARIARVLWVEGRHPEAIARWKSAIAASLRVQSRGVRVPDAFWGRVGKTFSAIGESHALGEVRNDIANLLRDYYQRNNEYRFDELLEPAARASIASGEGTGWLVELAQSMDNPEVVIDTLQRTPALTDAQKIALQRSLVAVRVKRAEGLFGDDRERADTSITQARWQLTSMLLEAGEVKGASEEWSQIAPEEIRNLDRTVEIRLASCTRTLDALLGRYGSDPNAPSDDVLQRAAIALRQDGDEDGARKVLEFLYERDIRNGSLSAANFLGLAEVKLQQSDISSALALLNRMALIAPEGFDTLLPAAELLSKHGRTSDAAVFLRRRIRAVPWDSEPKLALARSLPATSAERSPLLAAVALDTQAAYKIRAGAARLSAPQPIIGVSGELALLCAARLAIDAAEKPYEVEARIEAAGAAANPETKLRLWREALAIAPADSRAILGTLESSLALRRDNLSLALADTAGEQAQRPEISVSLAQAAERLNDLPAALDYLRTAIRQASREQRDALTAKLNLLQVEQDRRKRNIARQPAIKNVIEQKEIVGARIPGGVQ